MDPTMMPDPPPDPSPGMEHAAPERPSSPRVPRKIHVIRVRTAAGYVWSIFGDGQVLHSPPGQTRPAAIAAFEALHGKATTAIRHKGTMRPSEAAMTLAELKREGGGL